MAVLDKLARLLPTEAARCLEEKRARLTEIRLRANRQTQLLCGDTDELAGEVIGAADLREILSALMEHSFYAREAELARGYFTLPDGSRVGVCGRRYDGEGGSRLGEIGSICVRVARPVPGCADGLMDEVVERGRLRSTLLISPPGMGKTTMLRDIARQLSEGGFCVGIADERHEIAACRQGVPTMDVGPRTDVMDGCPRPEAIRQMVRAMAPDVIVADEIGGRRDARALADAARCGVAIIASAHAIDFASAALRPHLAAVLDSGVIQRIAMLGERPGRVVGIGYAEIGGREGVAWRFA